MSALDELIIEHGQNGELEQASAALFELLSLRETQHEAAMTIMQLEGANTRLAADLREQNKKLNDTLLLDESGRPAHLWQLIEERDALREQNRKLRDALENIKGRVCGNSRPVNDLANTIARCSIADICDSALAALLKEEEK